MNLRLNRKLKKIGSLVDTSYMLYLNNNDPVKFESQKSLVDYLSSYREENIIFKLQIFRCETYSL